MKMAPKSLLLHSLLLTKKEESAPIYRAEPKYMCHEFQGCKNSSLCNMKRAGAACHRQYMQHTGQSQHEFVMDLKFIKEFRVGKN